MKHRKLVSLVVLLAVGCWAQQYEEYDYDFGYDTYDGEEDFGDNTSNGNAGGSSSGGSKDDDFVFDEYGYYGDEDEEYYEYYGYYADDFAGYGDYYNDEYDYSEDCTMDSAGKPIMSNSTAACDIKITGVDSHADKLAGGLDGVYKLSSCYNGKAMYKRVDSPAGEDRVLWYSSTYGDWDVSNGSDPNEAEILMYGGDMEHASVPLFVTGWHLGADLKSSSASSADDYLPISASISCADGKVYDKTQYNQAPAKAKIGPVLNDEEMEAKYKYIYDKYSRADPSPTINFTFVVLLVMTGLTIVLAIPYFLLRKRARKNSDGSITTSFAQMLQQSKKKHSGHVA